MESKTFNTVCPKDCFGSCALKVKVENGKIIGVYGNKDHPVTKGMICVKGKNYTKMVYSKERLLYPLKRVGTRGDGEFRRIPWEEAIDTIHTRLASLKEEYGPESILYYCGSGNMGIVKEAAYGFWYQFGGFTSVYGDLCNAAGVEALNLTYGSRKSNALEDLENSKLIVLWGKNPANTHLHMMYHINRALKKGAKLVTIDPRISESSHESDLHLRPRCGTDGCLALGVAKRLIETNTIDIDFINKNTYGFDQFREFLKDYPLEKVAEITGVPQNEIEAFVGYIGDNPHYALVCGFGLQRYTNGGQTVRTIALLPALTGSIGKRGCGLYFGDKQGPGLVWPYLPQKPDKIRGIPLALLSTELNQQTNPPIKAMWIEAANPVTSNPNSSSLKNGMNKLDFIVVCDLFLTDTARMADIVLPAASPFEYYDLVKGYGHSYIQLQQKVIEPPGECKHESEVYRMLGRRFGFDETYLPENSLDVIERVIEASNLNTTREKLKEKAYLHQDFQEIAYSDLKFDTPSGKIEFYCQQMRDKWGQSPLPVYREPAEGKRTTPLLYKEYPLHFVTGHSRKKINSQFSNILELREDPLLAINPTDAKTRKIESGDAVRVFNTRGEVKLKAFVTDKVPLGFVHAFFGSWGDEANVNKLTADRLTDIGYGAAFHDCLVEVEKYFNNGKNS